MRTMLFTTIRERIGRFLPLLAVIVPAVAVALFATRLEHLPEVRNFIASMKSIDGEWWVLPAFFAIYAIFAIFLLPVGLLSVTAVLVWGWKLGGAIDLIACTLCALPPFLLARGGLSRWIEKRIPRDDVPVLDSTFVLFLLRVMPIVPYVALNYIAGSATRVRIRDFLLTLFVGSIPGVFMFAWFIDTMASGAIGAATQAKIFGVCALIAAAAIGLRVAANRWIRRA